MRLKLRHHAALPVTFALVLAFLTVAPYASPANALGMYNRAAAKAYSDQWALARNSEYPNWGNDCQNFASQVLLAGGYPTNGSTESQCDPSVWWKPYNLFSFWHWPWSWSVADCQRQLFSNRPQHFELWGSSPVYMQGGGDILHIGQDSLSPTHSRVLMGPGYDSVDGLYYQNLENQHTTDTYRRRWDLNLDPGWPLWPWLVNW